MRWQTVVLAGLATGTVYLALYGSNFSSGKLIFQIPQTGLERFLSQQLHLKKFPNRPQKRKPCSTPSSTGS